MPYLHLFRRRWNIASDDFVFPEVSEAIFRFTWFIAAVILFVVSISPDGTRQPIKCTHSPPALTFIIVLIVLNALIVVLCLITAHVSSQGTILYELPRRRVGALIYVRLVAFVFELVWNICGTIWMNEYPAECNVDIGKTMRAIVYLNWMMIVAFVCGFLVVFNPLSSFVANDEHNASIESMRSVWKRRLRWLCICAHSDDMAPGAFEEVADLFTSFFHDNELVLSDVWAGLLLLANYDVRIMNRRQLAPVLMPPPADWMNVRLASRMIDFASGAYGWPSYVINNRCSCRAACRLLRRLRCCRSCRCDQVLIVKDNCCRCNTAAFLLMTGNSENDLFYVSFNNRVFEIPFVVCADPISRSIVIAIRGSASMRDIVTDLCSAADQAILNHLDIDNTIINQQPNVVDICVQSSCGSAHRGMLKSAEYVYETLMRQNILQDMFVLYPNYQLIVTGHSLGGGVAALLGLILRSKYPQIRCFSFSPPGCVVSSELIAKTEEFVCSVVVGDDLIPRLTYHSMERLKQNIMDAIYNTDRAKYEILVKGCYRLLCSSASRSDEEIESSTSDNIDAEMGDDRSPLIGRTPTSRQNSYGIDETTTRPVEDRVRLHPPGRIMLLNVDTNTEWIDYRRLEDIKLSARMISDHQPHYVRKVLRSAAARMSSSV